MRTWSLVDSSGVIYEGRASLNSHKARFAGPDTGARTLADAMKGADMFLGGCPWAAWSRPRC